MNDKVTIGFRQLLTENVCNRKDWPSNLQNVHTPWALCKQIVDKLVESTDFKNKKILTINLEFVEVLCYDYSVERKNIWFVTDCEQKALIAKTERYNGINVVVSDYLSNNMKFDVIVGNPPYQAPQVIKNDKGISGGGATLWDKFVVKSFELLKKDGYLCMVHPSGWRDVVGKFENVKDTLLSNTIKYLEIHDERDGQKTFGAGTRYDWYVAQKKSNTWELIEMENGKKVNISKLPFIPNGMFDEIQALIAKEGEETCEVLFSRSGYGTDKTNMSMEEKDDFKYPCVYTITANGEKVNLWYSNTNKNGHFGIPKVIFTNGAGSSAIVDATGEFGLCQFSYAIVDSPENLPLIQKAMVSEKFLEIMKACQTQGSNKYSWKVMKCFRKDFYKEFVDENGNEI